MTAHKEKAMAKQDIRIIKTQRALASAMLTLLERQDFANITVNDLCAEALVSRSTFYVHFEDKYALLRFCMDSLVRQLFDEDDVSLEQRLKGLLEGIRDNVRVFKNLMMVNYDSELYDMIHRDLHADMEKRFAAQKADREALPGPLDVISVFYASGVTSAVMLWVRRNMPYSVDEMAACLLALVPER